MSSPTRSVALSLEEQELIKTFREAKQMALKARASDPAVPEWARASNEGLQGPYMGSAQAASTTLFDMDKLHIPEEHREWFARLMTEAQIVMSKNDISHNWEHIQRVVAIALRIYESEIKLNPFFRPNPTILFAAMIMHDVGDGKYIKDDEDPETKTKECLAKANIPPEFVEPIWIISDGVSYSAEIKDPERVRNLINKYPELAIVQDSDRIDSLGVVGISRGFGFGGASEKRKLESFDIGAQMIWTRFHQYLPITKTEEGRRMAVERWPEMAFFWKQFQSEVDVTSVLPSISNNNP